MKTLLIGFAILIAAGTVTFAGEDEAAKACIKQCSDTCAASSGEDRAAYTTCMRQCLKDECGIDNPPDRWLIIE